MCRRRTLIRIGVGGLMMAAAVSGCSAVLGQGENTGQGKQTATEAEAGTENPGVRIEVVYDMEEEAEGEESSEEALKESWPEREISLPPIGNHEFYPGDIVEEEYLLAEGEDEFFTISPISDEVFARMDGNSYREGCPVSREELRYVEILYYDFSGNARVGELVCHQSVSADLLRIFRQLFQVQYPIEKVALIDNYGGDDNLSSGDNNTSCFNYRTVEGSEKLSLHALGLAVDINPLYNPYVVWRADGTFVCTPREGEEYADRGRDFPYKIDEEDLCCRLFKGAGFTWGGSWGGHPDYMHFSRGSRPER